MKSPLHVGLNTSNPLSDNRNAGKGLCTRRVACLTNLGVIATTSLSDRNHVHSLTVLLVCQGGIPVEYGQIRPLQVIEIREVNGRGERI